MITLYKKHASGRIGTFRIWAEDNVIQMATDLGTGEETVRTEIVPHGKANRTLIEQVESRIQSRVNAKLDRGYKRTRKEADTGANTNTLDLFQPMLASSNPLKLLNTYKDVLVQPKLDGMRMIVTRDPITNKVVAYSRQGKLINTVDHILSSMEAMTPVGVYFDGELYVHGLPLQTIMSRAKRWQPETEELEYNIFDTISDAPFRTRYSALEAWMVHLCPARAPLRLVPTHDASKENVQDLMKEYRHGGYEGLILRAGSEPYAPGKRPQHIAKLKEFFEDEYLCVDVTTGERGEPVLVCETATGQGFRVTAPGTHADRRHALENPDLFTGQYVTIKHAGLTPYGIPFHPVCLGKKQ